MSFALSLLKGEGRVRVLLRSSSNAQSPTSILSLLRKGEATHQHSALILRFVAMAVLTMQVNSEQVADEC
jgi:hypothetical protein